MLIAITEYACGESPVPVGPTRVEPTLPLYPDSLPPIEQASANVVRFDPPRRVAEAGTLDRRALREWLVSENGISSSDPRAWIVHPPHAFFLEAVGPERAAECWRELVEERAFQCRVGRSGSAMYMDTWNIELSIGLRAVGGLLAPFPLRSDLDQRRVNVGWREPVLLDTQLGPSEFDPRVFEVVGPKGWQAERRGAGSSAEWVWVTFPPPAFVREVWGADHWARCTDAFARGTATTCRVEHPACGAVALDVDGSARIEVRNACIRGALDGRRLTISRYDVVDEPSTITQEEPR